ncbi:MAG: hypothetical protein H7A35_00660 [Planctomycetales bacterium]|nr:hypothetical protein [bacterium]UNM08574.1 MAG: hypothetical protein H7A35_00660 [Planctomycetales bacterium]
MHRILIPLMIIALFAVSCGGNATPVPVQPGQGALTDMPADNGAIPEDSLLPWESLNENGFVDPATARRSTAINENSEFWRGVDAWQVAGSTTNVGQALRLDSGSAGSGERSSATYRIPLTGENPAILSTDINLRKRDDDSASGFYISIANFETGRWDWFGQYSDGRIRLSLSEAATGNYISGLGNAFVSVVAYNGSSFDIVGVSLNQFDPADATAPPAPSGLSLAARVGAVEMQWNGVIAADLAGYAIYYSDKTFVNPGSAGVKKLNYLEGGTRHLLSGVSGTVFVAVSAVDLSGNESAISSVESTAVIAGDGPVLELLAGSTEGIVGEPITLTASGSPAFDWDLDGDGTFEVTGDVSGSQLADTGKAGILRPAVRGSDGATAVALGAVSLIIAQDLPPVAVLTANRLRGAIINGETSPLSVNFSAGQSYDDGPTLDFAWALTGDASFGPAGPADSNSYQYSKSGVFVAMIRAEDSAGQVAYAQLPISVEQVTGFRASFLCDNPAGLFGSLAIVDGHPAVAFRRFGPGAALDGLFYNRALDSEGKLWGEPVPLQTQPNWGDFACLAVIAGNPAIAYNNGNVPGICYIRASSSTGQTLADWNNAPVVLTTPAFASEEIELIDLNGNPAVVWFDSGDIWFQRATSAAGTGDNAGDWGDPAIEIYNAGNADVRPDFKIIDGNPAVAFRQSAANQAMYLRATSSTGASALDWPGVPVVVSAAHTVTGRVNLEFVSGAPAVSYYESGNSLRYTRANTSTGSIAADWPLSTVIDEGFGQGTTWHDLAMVGGRPAIAYEDFQSGQHTKYRRANNSTGSSWGEEWHVAPQNDWQDSAYMRIDLEDLNGFPAIYVHHQNFDRPSFYTFDTEL